MLSALFIHLKTGLLSSFLQTDVEIKAVRVICHRLKSLKHVLVNQKVKITAKITNTQDGIQDFVYIVQIKDENDVVVKLGWISGSLTKYQSFSPSLSWTPKDSGVYLAEIFVWDTLLTQGALTNTVTLEIITS